MKDCRANIVAVSVRAIDLTGANPKCTVYVRMKSGGVLIFEVKLTETDYEAALIGEPPEDDAGPYASIAIQAASSVLEVQERNHLALRAVS